tara:strand:+ start:598 stop:1026 length:429 start_codon:yes stop_codon:yes gene_type:complete
MNFVEIDIKNSSHIEYLYSLLKDKKFNISHNKFPTFIDHKKFVENNPYRKWFLIYIKNLVSGSVYITNENYIGINLPSNNTDNYFEILQYIFENFDPLNEVKSIRNKYFMVNTTKDNINLINALERHLMKEIQRTYIFKNKK